MTASDLLTLWFIQYPGHLPELLGCLGLAVWVLVYWQRVPASRAWALLGFGSLLGLVLLSPLPQVLVRYWEFDDHDSAERIGAKLTVYALGVSAMHALAYGFLAAAIYTGRSVPTAPTTPAASLPPPLPRPLSPPPL